ncbi:hypothetical protein TNCV_3269031 [Trichonephila clavipes]|nr:hypothetical protein TNCV_3269031 [Trichonephila clavipes]
MTGKTYTPPATTLNQLGHYVEAEWRLPTGLVTSFFQCRVIELWRVIGNRHRHVMSMTPDLTPHSPKSHTNVSNFTIEKLSRISLLTRRVFSSTRTPSYD